MFDKHDRNFVIATAAGVAGFVALGGALVLSREGYVLGLVSFLLSHGSGMFGGLSGPSGISAFVHLGAACERLRALGVLKDTQQ